MRVHGVDVLGEVAVLGHAGQVHGIGGGGGEHAPLLPVLHMVDQAGTRQPAPVGRLQEYIQARCTK